MRVEFLLCKEELGSRRNWVQDDGDPQGMQKSRS